MKKINLNKEEKAILRSVENGEWRSIKNKENDIERYEEIAKATFKKDRRINIRISSKDINALQTKALEDGLPYQTLISSILHRYVSGRLIEKKI